MNPNKRWPSRAWHRRRSSHSSTLSSPLVCRGISRVWCRCVIVLQQFVRSQPPKSIRYLTDTTVSPALRRSYKYPSKLCLWKQSVCACCSESCRTSTGHWCFQASNVLICIFTSCAANIYKKICHINISSLKSFHLTSVMCMFVNVFFNILSPVWSILYMIFVHMWWKWRHRTLWHFLLHVDRHRNYRDISHKPKLTIFLFWELPLLHQYKASYPSPHCETIVSLKYCDVMWTQPMENIMNQK